MEFGVITQSTFEKVNDNGQMLLEVFYMGDAPGNACTVYIYSFDEHFYLIPDWGEGYGPAKSFEEALQWDGFDYASLDFKMISDTLSESTLRRIEDDFRNRMKQKSADC
ncbi:hypothetical protein [Robiginitalea biformata]|uniref:Uncharacterized protein n=1 Tax=Robiginitalea biformata (strain ATCC BAA-864 / DSM 15991 / KCTC 12146 / HTCC2501) TaxID=313596 RepID=A4CI97_ROBBH|nr:hypothetical protein [Robiginitalea biformata]EAR16655.1 hypothetical protein RB2501_07135 [Robiginitalea biformata HTCC2501]